MSDAPDSSGIVFLVGAGPGDPGLLTRRGHEILSHADVVIYDGLVSPAVLELAAPAAQQMYAGKKHAPGGQALTQHDINGLLIDHARAGKRVVRLKGGDPFVFGRGAEECCVLAEAGVRFEIVPGVTAATAVAAYAGIPLTARGVASTVAFATGHEAAGKPHSDVDWEALARAGTVVLFMAWRTVRECCDRLIAAGRAPDTPAAAVYWGTTAQQTTVVSTLDRLPGAVGALRPPILIIVGEVVSLRDYVAWYERRPLFGARVLITRNPEQARGFARAVQAFGGEPLVMPVTRIAPPDERDRAHIERALSNLSSYDWIILTSANSAHRLFEELDARGLDARALASARIACIGRATARAARSHGIRADVVPARGDAERIARAVIDEAGASIRGARVLFPRAAHGRDEAAAALRQAGADVDITTVYRTEPTRDDDPTIARALARIRAGKVDVMAFFAPSQVRATFALLGDRASELVRACRVIAAIGNTTSAALRAHNVEVHVVPSRPDSEILAQEIAASFHR